MSPAFSSFAAFLNMGGYAVYVWLAVAVAVAAFGLLTVHTLWARRALFHEVRRQQA
ncbi:heme exporter protein CcmD, partial [Klebsiella pneumoniae]|nr:heme exporter protein CcmD [Klebsiella pneumoniae]